MTEQRNVAYDSSMVSQHLCGFPSDHTLLLQDHILSPVVQQFHLQQQHSLHCYIVFSIYVIKTTLFLLVLFDSTNVLVELLDNSQALAQSNFLHFNLFLVKLSSEAQGNKQILDSCTTNCNEHKQNGQCENIMNIKGKDFFKMDLRSLSHLLTINYELYLKSDKMLQKS